MPSHEKIQDDIAKHCETHYIIKKKLDHGNFIFYLHDIV